MEDRELDRIDALCAAATPGPWRAARVADDVDWWNLHAGADVRPTGANAAFIADARTSVPALAEGRLMRDVLWRLKYDRTCIGDRGGGESALIKSLHLARKILRAKYIDAGWTGGICRVTRIRRAP